MTLRSAAAAATASLFCLALGSGAGCDQSRTVGSRWIRSQTLRASTGGTVEVPAASGEPLSGASLRVDPGGLHADTLVTLEQGAAPITAALHSAGPVAVWGPTSLALAKEGQMTLPFVLATGQSAADLVVAFAGADGALQKIDHAKLGIDAARGLVRFAVERLGAYQALAMVRCQTDPDCGAGRECDNGECRAPDAGTPCNTLGCLCTLSIQCLAPLVCRESECREELHDGGVDGGDGGHP